VAQPFGYQQKLQPKQQPHHDAGAPGAIADPHALAAGGHHQPHQCGGDARAQANLEDRCNLARHGLKRDLLQAPYEAQDQHQGDGLPIERFARCHSESPRGVGSVMPSLGWIVLDLVF
jgi:hypothetical protein